jgi:hypothetical protein
MEAAIRTALQKGDLGIRKIAVKLGVATGTVQRVKAKMAALGSSYSAGTAYGVLRYRRSSTHHGWPAIEACGPS